MTVKLVLADDEQLVRSGLRLILEAEDDIEVVGEAERRRRGGRRSRGAWTRTWCSWTCRCP